MWNVLLMFGYFGVIGCLGVLLYSIFDELFGLGISVVVVGIGLAVFCFYANSQYNIEKIDDLNTKLIERVVNSARTLKPGKWLTLDKTHHMLVTKTGLQVDDPAHV